MKLILPFALSFVFACFLGLTAELIVPQLFYHAQQVFDDKPLPILTEWNFQNLAGWRNGSLLCLFVLPWAVLLLYGLGLSSPRTEGSIEGRISLLYGFLLFLMSEVLLFLFFAVSSLMPFLPHYGITQGGIAIPAYAYVPHILLGVVVLGIARMVAKRYA